MAYVMVMCYWCSDLCSSDLRGRWFGGSLPIDRSMPNTPALIGAGATGLCANSRVSPAQKAQAQHILDAAGITRWIDDEALMDTVTALSGSGPAYFFAQIGRAHV